MAYKLSILFRERDRVEVEGPKEQLQGTFSLLNAAVGGYHLDPNPAYAQQYIRQNTIYISMGPYEMQLVVKEIAAVVLVNEEEE